MTTEYCDNCGEPVTDTNSDVYPDCPFPTTSTNTGESAIVCKVCRDIILEAESTINIKPDELLNMAYDIVEQMERDGYLHFTKKHPIGDYTIYLFKALVSRREAIWKSSWFANHRERLARADRCIRKYLKMEQDTRDVFRAYTEQYPVSK